MAEEFTTSEHISTIAILDDRIKQLEHLVNPQTAVSKLRDLEAKRKLLRLPSSTSDHSTHRTYDLVTKVPSYMTKEASDTLPSTLLEQVSALTLRVSDLLKSHPDIEQSCKQLAKIDQIFAAFGSSSSLPSSLPGQLQSLTEWVLAFEAELPAISAQLNRVRELEHVIPELDRACAEVDLDARLAAARAQEAAVDAQLAQAAAVEERLVAAVGAYAGEVHAMNGKLRSWSRAVDTLGHAVENK